MSTARTGQRSPRHDEHVGPYGYGFWIGLCAGWALIGWGIVGVLQSVWLKDRPASVAWWVLGGLVVHDAVIAPLITLAALACARLLPARVRGPVAGALALSAVVLLFAYPLLRGFGRRAANPTILPLDYGRNVGIVLALVWIGAAAVVAVRVVRERRP